MYRLPLGKILTCVALIDDGKLLLTADVDSPTDDNLIRLWRRDISIDAHPCRWQTLSIPSRTCTHHSNTQTHARANVCYLQTWRIGLKADQPIGARPDRDMDPSEAVSLGVWL